MHQVYTTPFCICSLLNIDLLHHLLPLVHSILKAEGSNVQKRDAREHSRFEMARYREQSLC